MFAKLTPNKVVNFGDENVLHDIFLWPPVVRFYMTRGLKTCAVTSFVLAYLN